MLGPGIGVPESPFSFSSRVDAALFFIFILISKQMPLLRRRKEA
jgi:hypothetical protein